MHSLKLENLADRLKKYQGGTINQENYKACL